ncbi:MAG TPA: S-adenosylmethionine:tRNA ribosyltransferase-isomerase [Patescibacteria group bacterium]|nr:S-adenosylmethionine:tRNA ribosyltransferase-isomerase [Patescibacteria group bacterium]
MSQIPDIDLREFIYELPTEQIALYPLEKRDESKLLKVDVSAEEISHFSFKNLPQLLPQNSLLVVNSTRVIHARIIMQKTSGGRAEVLCAEPLDEMTTALTLKGKSLWTCLVGGRKIEVGAVLKMSYNNLELTAKIIEKNGTNAVVEFRWQPEILTFAEVLEIAGKVPLPPYLKRDVESSDSERYQTVFSKEKGSVAAPTASLHFSEEVLKELLKKGIGRADVTLHVGLGTFKPVEAEKILDHAMHGEKLFVTRQTIETLLGHCTTGSLQDRGRLIAAGTTSVRTLESLYWWGVKLLQSEEVFKRKFLKVSQWESYFLEEESDGIRQSDVFKKILEWMDFHGLQELSGETEIIIIPGYTFKIVNAIITNFHQPESTLILLVAAFMGKELWRKAYDEALKNNYRFLSYGDASLLLK